MDYPIIFARHFTRLVWLLLHESANTDEQKAALRAMAMVSKDGPVHLVRREGRLSANTLPLPEALPGVADLLERMRTHGVDELLVDVAATPADLLGLARALASPGGMGSRASELQLATVRVLKRASAAPTAATPTAPASPAAPAPAPAPAGEAPKLAEFAMDLELVDPEEAHAAISEKFGDEPITGPAVLVPLAGTEDVVAEFAAALKEGDPQTVLARFDAATAMHHRGAMLDEMATMIERSAREGKAMLAADLVGGIVTREAEAPEGTEERKMLGRAVRRLLKAGVLRQVAMLLPRKRGRIEEYEAVLIRAGEDGADALIEQLTQATTAEDRRTYYNLLVRLRTGVAALVHMLGDHRWYVVRNAADLLGEMDAKEGEAGLIELLRHPDERVRRAASTALVRLGTPKGVQAVHEVMRQSSPEMRALAASALAGRRNTHTAQTLVRAFDEEENEEVQLAIVAALGKIATPDAVQRLVQAAEPGGRLFRKKSMALRLAAVQALAEAKTPAALSALRSLGDDREKDVKEAATRALQRG